MLYIDAVTGAAGAMGLAYPGAQASTIAAGPPRRWYPDTVSNGSALGRRNGRDAILQRNPLIWRTLNS